MFYSSPLHPLALAPVRGHKIISASVCYISDPLEQQNTIQPSFVFSGGQTSNNEMSCQYSKTEETNLFFSQPPEKPLFWMHSSTLSIVREKSEVKEISPTIPSELQDMSMVSECMLVQNFVFVLSSCQPGTLSYQHLDLGKTKASPLGRP